GPPSRRKATSNTRRPEFTSEPGTVHVRWWNRTRDGRTVGAWGPDHHRHGVRTAGRAAGHPAPDPVGAQASGPPETRMRGTLMRDAYHEELDSIGDGLVEMARLVGSAIGRATTAILDADLKLAEHVIEGDQKVDELQHELEARAITLLARQQPVATDLRIVVTSLRMSADLARSGDLAQHVAKLGRLRYPARAVPRDLHATILEMGQLAQRLMAKAGEVIIPKDVDLALQLETDDDAMHLLHRTLFQHLMDDRWKHGIETAVDVTLLGRYYERFADHAVSVAKRVVYLVTGEHADEIQSDLQPVIQPAPGVEGA